MKRTLFVWHCMFGAVVLASSAIAQAGQPLRYLPPTPVNFGGTDPSSITNYGPVVHFDQSVVDDAKQIDVGMIRFDYTHDFEVETSPPPPNDPLAGGAALAGGLVLNDGVEVKEGFNLAWVQTILSSSSTGDAQTRWGVTAMNPDEYPDAGHDSPAYGSASLPDGANNPMPMPDFAFQDFPRRTFSGGNSQFWRAELGLACIAKDADDNGFREVRVVDTFLWGFDINVNGDGMLDIGDVNPYAPAFWSDPTQSYLDTLNEAYDGDPGMKYMFASNSNCFQAAVPEPASLLLLCSGVFVLLRRDRR